MIGIVDTDYIEERTGGDFKSVCTFTTKFDPLLSLLMPEQDLQGDHGSGPKPSELPMEEAF